MSRFLFVVFAVLLALPFASPAAAYDTDHVFITNRQGSNIVELDETLTYVRTWFQGEVFDGMTLSLPNGMAFTPSGDLFVADTGNNRIVAIDSTGRFLRSFSTLERLGGAVESIYFDRDGILFASSNPGLGVVGRYQQDGTEEPDVVADEAYVRLGNVNLTAAGDVVVSDFLGMRGLRELDVETGELLRTYGEDLGLQEDVMIDGADRVFVSHFASDEIVVFGPAPDRVELFRFTAPDEAELQLIRPTGIALTADCDIVVASFMTGGIFIFKHLGAELPPRFERVLRPGIEIPASADLGQVESIAVEGLGLPGSFNEFATMVPTCDPAPPVMDAGVDAGTDAGTDAGADTGMGDTDRVDTGASDTAIDTATPPPTGDDGCDCRVTAGSSTGPAPLLALLAFCAVARKRGR